MPAALLNSALKLSPAERILLVEQIWDSIADEAAETPLTRAQSDELKRRLDRIEKTGPRGEGWRIVKSRIAGRSKK